MMLVAGGGHSRSPCRDAASIAGSLRRCQYNSLRSPAVVGLLTQAAPAAAGAGSAAASVDWHRRAATGPWHPHVLLSSHWGKEEQGVSPEGEGGTR